MAAGDLGATDLFSLGAGFNPQSATVSSARTLTEVLGANGDGACLTPFMTVVNATADYEVCGSQTLSIGLGDVVGGYIVTAVELAHKAGEAPTVSIQGTAYDGGETVAGRTYDISQAVNIASVVSLIGSGLDANAEATEVSYRWECQLTTGVGSDGQVSFVSPRTPKLTYTESGIGTATSTPVISGYTLESYENSDSNQEIDTYTATFIKQLTSTVV